VRGAEPGRAILTPLIEDAEEMQGFPRDWTKAALEVARPGVRWKLVGNAVTVGVSEWLGRRLQSPGDYDETGELILPKGMKWPTAAWGNKDQRWDVPVGLWPEQREYRHLLDVMNPDTAAPLSLRATSGFHNRLLKSRLRYSGDFSTALKEHVAYMQGLVSMA
jgi:DNA (cytosine-5)-methyltransferase 1